MISQQRYGDPWVLREDYGSDGFHEETPSRGM